MISKKIKELAPVECPFLRKAIILLCIVSLAVACRTGSSDSKASKSYDNFYEIYVPHWGEDDALTNISEKLGHFESLFIDAIVLSPLQPVSDRLKIGQLGSPFAISDHRAFDESHGSSEEFRELVASFKSRGIDVFMDWFPAICGHDNALANYADTMVISDALEDRHNLSFNDVTLIDYTKDEAVDLTMDAMTKWIEEYGLDGLRIHHAHRLPKRFADDLRRKTGATIIYGERGRDDDASLGYHMDYSLLDALKSAFSDSIDLEPLKELIAMEDRGKAINFNSNLFVSSRSENHLSLFGSRGRMSAALTFLIDGSPLILSGQEIPINRPVSMYFNRDIQWPKKTMLDFYRELILLRDRNKAIQPGISSEVRFLDMGAPGVLAFEKKHKGHTIIGLFNFNNDAVNLVPGEPIFNVNDYQQRRPIQIRAGAEFKLAPGQFLLFTNS